MPETIGPDIWLVLDRSSRMTGSATSQAAAPQTASQLQTTRWQRGRQRVQAILRDAFATALWLYIGLQLLVVDVFSFVFGADATSARFVVTHRAIPASILCLILSVFFWRWKTLWSLIYVAFFPLIVICWKFPKVFVKARLYRNTVAMMALMNAAMLLAKNIRYHLISKSVGVVAVVLIVLPTSSSVVLLGAGIVLLLLALALVRVVLQTFRSGAFVASQRKLLSLAAKVTDSPLQLNVATQSDGTVTQQQADQLANSIQTAAITNRLMYLWAYKLQQYRETSFVVVFNTLSYASLFLGATVAFFLINLAVLRANPGQYAGPAHPSVVALYLYSLSSMAFADGGGLSPAGDLAYGIRIVAELFGPGFLLTVVINTLLALRGSREDTELKDTVRDLRRRARRHEARFHAATRVGIDEACQRLVTLGLGNLIVFLNWFQQVIPADFIGDDISGVE